VTTAAGLEVSEGSVSGAWRLRRRLGADPVCFGERRRPVWRQICYVAGPSCGSGGEWPVQSSATGGQ
jgi:hypothetical protein